MSILNKISNYWWCQIGGWGIVGLSILFYAYTLLESIPEDYLKRILILMASGILSTHILRFFIKKNNWLLLAVEKVFLKLAVAVILTSILFSLLVMAGNDLFNLESRRPLDFTTRLFANFINIGIYIIPWVLLYYFYHYMSKSRRQQLDTLKLEALVKELELKTIKSHINPHFIFNALNSVRALIDENPERARTAITELSNILRSSMQAEKLETVPFEKELNIVQDYLALEHIRFEDRLSVEYEIDEDTLDQPVPPMMLQTLVENAIKHGISKQVNGGTVKIISDFKDNYHQLLIQNTGRLNGAMNQEGFGLASTQNRLHLMFGENARFQIKETNGNMVEAKVQIPIAVMHKIKDYDK